MGGLEGPPRPPAFGAPRGTRGAPLFAHYTRGTTLAHYTRGTTLAHYTRGTTLAHYTRGTTLAHYTRGTTLLPQALTAAMLLCCRSPRRRARSTRASRPRPGRRSRRAG